MASNQARYSAGHERIFGADGGPARRRKALCIFCGAKDVGPMHSCAPEEEGDSVTYCIVVNYIIGADGRMCFVSTPQREAIEAWKCSE